jgi:diaminohydroxyphosphoribosylaminopyrimidine deaminase/5-amino-6-(5-phosphoribosylamino)uracil reductase
MQSPRAPTDFDVQMMRLALSHGSAGTPAPNPHVGAVLVRDGAVIGVGHHDRAGGAHAEIAAMADADYDVRGATLYVTLEPCNHHGRTPPCCDAILREGVARVVIGCRDLNPRVGGGGVERLRAAGVEVVVGVCESEAFGLIGEWMNGLRGAA